MTWILAAGVGAALGLAYFGGLWLTVSRALNCSKGAAWVPASGVLRLSLLAVGLALIGRGGPVSMLAALGGIWLARGYLVRRLGGVHHGA